MPFPDGSCLDCISSPASPIPVSSHPGELPQPLDSLTLPRRSDPYLLPIPSRLSQVIWFLPAVKQLVRNYDPDLPHAITDRAYHLYCLPCHWDPDNPPMGDVDGSGVPLAPRLSEAMQLQRDIKPPRACPSCSVDVACGGRKPNNVTAGFEEGQCGQGTWYAKCFHTAIGKYRPLDTLAREITFPSNYR